MPRHWATRCADRPFGHCPAPLLRPTQRRYDLGTLVGVTNRWPRNAPISAIALVAARVMQRSGQEMGGKNNAKTSGMASTPAATPRPCGIQLRAQQPATLPPTKAATQFTINSVRPSDDCGCSAGKPLSGAPKENITKRRPQRQIKKYVEIPTPIWADRNDQGASISS